jgi:protein-S-isoprenylcysteine O-methyltransferase Ste14
MATVYRLAALEEERCFLRSSLGEEYREYLRITGGFVPRIFGLGPR